MIVAGAQLPATLPAAAFARVPDHVVYRPFPHETVVLNLQTGRYHGLNPTAGRMLELLEQGRSAGETARIVADECERPLVEVERDLQAFYTDLAARGLIELSLNGRR